MSSVSRKRRTELRRVGMKGRSKIGVMCARCSGEHQPANCQNMITPSDEALERFFKAVWRERHAALRRAWKDEVQLMRERGAR